MEGWGGGQPPDPLAAERGQFLPGWTWYDAPITDGASTAYPPLQLDLAAPLGLPPPPPPLPPAGAPPLPLAFGLQPDGGLAGAAPAPIMVPLPGQDLQQQQDDAMEREPEAAQQHARGGGGRKGGRKGGGRSSAAAEEERRARNRATQARFRERQKVRRPGGGGARPAVLRRCMRPPPCPARAAPASRPTRLPAC